MIQVDSEIAAEPSIGDIVQITAAHQNPAIFGETSKLDLAMEKMIQHWSLEVRPV